MTPNKTRLTVRKASSVQPVALEWLWPARIPKGKVTVLAGNPGVGKGLITCDLAAALTTGRKFPDCENKNAPMDVAMLACEDGEADTIRPRLEAAGADLDRVHFIDSKVKLNDKAPGRWLALDHDITPLRDLLTENPSIKLVIIDPISSYLGNVKMEKEQEVRRVLGSLAQLAEETGVTFLLVMHFNKRWDVSALHRVTGAVAMTGVARATWVCAPDPESNTDECLLMPTKMNVGKRVCGLRYGIEEKQLSYGPAPVIVWRGTTNITADQALSAKPETGRLTKAKEWLAEYLVSDTPATQVYAAAKTAGISERTLKRAKNDLAIESERCSDGLSQDPQWLWIAPARPEALLEAYANFGPENIPQEVCK